MARITLALVRLLAAAALFAPVCSRASRVKDLTTIEGARDNQLVGYGVVVGLAGDGDSNAATTQTSIANVLKRFGLSITASDIKSKNIATVMLTADIPAFVKPGSRIDVKVAAMGDAKSLQGSILLQTPLVGADGRVYAVAQGPVAIGGIAAGALFVLPSLLLLIGLTSAYLIWGLFPLYFKAIEQIPAFEIIVHRISWSALFGALLLQAVLFVVTLGVDSRGPGQGPSTTPISQRKVIPSQD